MASPLPRATPGRSKYISNPRMRTVLVPLQNRPLLMMMVRYRGELLSSSCGFAALPMHHLHWNGVSLPPPFGRLIPYGNDDAWIGSVGGLLNYRRDHGFRFT